MRSVNLPHLVAHSPYCSFRYTINRPIRGFPLSQDLLHHKLNISYTRPFAYVNLHTLHKHQHKLHKPRRSLNLDRGALQALVVGQSNSYPTMATQDVPKTCKVILADTIARGLLTEVKDTLKSIQKDNEGQPTLVAFLANGDPAAVKYAEWSKKTCEENGFTFDLRQVDKDKLEEEIMNANEDNKVDGIIVYYPIFPGNPAHDRYVQETVSLSKDVEGLCHKHIHNMYYNVRFLDPPQNLKKSILPCTPLAVVKILEYLQIYNSILPYGNRLFGRTITVINRSEVNGRPLAALLANDGATVYSVDITGVQLFTRGQGIKQPRHQVQDKEGWTLEQCIPISDVIIGGVPTEKFKVPTELIRDGTVCINFSSFRNFDGPAIKEKASIYVPSVGKVTIAVLLRNLVRLIANRPSTNKDGSTDESTQKAKSEAFVDG
ncbi:putative methylenetetrahydrofolate dehydrogenase [Daldinia vernicosa]|uniref:putative methylenetetrahydrofolate dehydrogenase n=1 Tax=Daldinia vernicosa TaxID=114800 RepID=UPI00200806A0|nr:putative methylenetetrahydrofolate dehydrogenase [Daldinia vernicosa]KAI0846885.1 putative methylenetetrahydrofolate dehydrogenase [Daldinia vernicosa]